MHGASRACARELLVFLGIFPWLFCMNRAPAGFQTAQRVVPMTRLAEGRRRHFEPKFVEVFDRKLPKDRLCEFKLIVTGFQCMWQATGQI